MILRHPIKSKGEMTRFPEDSGGRQSDIIKNHQTEHVELHKMSACILSAALHLNFSCTEDFSAFT